MSGLAPKLRFKQDDGSDFPEWEEKELNEIAVRCRERNANSEITRVLTNSAVQGVVDQSKYFDKDIANADSLARYYIVQNGDFVYNPRISVSAPVGPIKRNNLGTGVMSPLYTVIRFKSTNTDFYDHYFQSNMWHEYMKSVANYGARHDRMAITTHDFMALPIPFPSLPEQKKIADFLSSVDAKIDAVKRKLDALERYKKGLMQQIFSQKIRFKQDDGSDFPEWEEKRLGDVAAVTGGYAFKSLNFEDIGIPIVRISNIDACSGYVDLSQAVYHSPSKGMAKFTIQKGDILIALSGATTGKAAIYNISSIAYLNQRVGRLVLKDKKTSYSFLVSLVFSKMFSDQLDTVLVAGAQPNISPKDIEEFTFDFPSLPEQQKIADFLSSMDAKIDAIKAHIDKLEAFKKGLLQQMFV